MLPSPTAELLLILGTIKQQVGDDTNACAQFLNGVCRQLRVARRERKVVVLRAMVPEIETARDGAEGALRGLCLICPRRNDCEGRLA